MPARANLSGCLKSCCWSKEPLFGEAACFSWRSHHVYLDHPAYPTVSALHALRTADLVVIGPGDLYTSIIPNLLVDGITDAIAQAQNRVFVVNLMTKAGESDNFRASTFVERLLDYLQPAVLDAVLVNTQHPPVKVLQRYAREGAQPVEVEADVIES